MLQLQVFFSRSPNILKFFIVFIKIQDCLVQVSTLQPTESSIMQKFVIQLLIKIKNLKIAYDEHFYPLYFILVQVFGKILSSLPNKKILDWSNWKVFADNKINVTEKSKICFQKGTKHCGKRRKCWLPAFSLFPLMSLKGFFSISLKVGIV